MASQDDKLENALNESRILILGAQVMIGFGYSAFFQTGFVQLGAIQQLGKLISLGLMVLSLGLLLSPIPYERIAGESGRALHRFTHKAIEYALLPFAIALSMDIYIAGEKLLPSVPGWILGAAALSIALFFWFGLEYGQRGRKRANGA